MARRSVDPPHACRSSVLPRDDQPAAGSLSSSHQRSSRCSTSCQRRGVESQSFGGVCRQHLRASEFRRGSTSQWRLVGVRSAERNETRGRASAANDVSFQKWAVPREAAASPEVGKRYILTQRHSSSARNCSVWNGHCGGLATNGQVLYRVRVGLGRAYVPRGARAFPYHSCLSGSCLRDRRPRRPGPLRRPVAGRWFGRVSHGTVYGLGANALDEVAVARVFEAKGGLGSIR